MKLSYIQPRLLVLAILLGASVPTEAGTIRVLAYGDSADEASQIASASNGTTTLDVDSTTSLSSITSANLANYDVFFAGTSFHDDLDPYATILQDYLTAGGSIVVGQPNQTGPIDWLPSSLSVDVADYFYHSSGVSALTVAGTNSPIFSGLSAADLGGPPADSIYASDLGLGWTVLATHTQGADVHVSMATGAVGASRVLLWDRLLYGGSSSVFPAPSSALIRQAFEWVASPELTTSTAPEPTSMALFGLGALSLGFGYRRRRKDSELVQDVSAS